MHLLKPNIYAVEDIGYLGYRRQQQQHQKEQRHQVKNPWIFIAETIDGLVNGQHANQLDEGNLQSASILENVNKCAQYEMALSIVPVTKASGKGVIGV